MIADVATFSFCACFAGLDGVACFICSERASNGPLIPTSFRPSEELESFAVGLRTDLLCLNVITIHLAQDRLVQLDLAESGALLLVVKKLACYNVL